MPRCLSQLGLRHVGTLRHQVCLCPDRWQLGCTWDDDPIWLIVLGLAAPTTKNIFVETRYSITGTSLNSINFGFYTFTLWIAAKWAVSAGKQLLARARLVRPCESRHNLGPFKERLWVPCLQKRGWWWAGSEKTQRTMVLGLFLSDFNDILWQISTINVCLQFSPIGW